MMNLDIRQERPEEFPALYSLVQNAFKTAQVTSGHEEDFAERLRASSGYIPALALVADLGGTAVGHVMLTRAAFAPDDGGEVRTLLLAPLSVLLKYRRQGIGEALVRDALARAKAMGFDAVFLAGDPTYFNCFGFERADSFGISSDTPIPPKNLLALELRPGALTPGKVEIRS